MCWWHEPTFIANLSMNAVADEWQQFLIGIGCQCSVKRAHYVLGWLSQVEISTKVRRSDQFIVIANDVHQRAARGGLGWGGGGSS